MVFAKLALAATALLLSTASVGVSETSPLEAQLRAQDERLLAAIKQGGRTEWSQVTTPDFLYVEEGEIMTRDQLLAQMDYDGRRPLLISEFHVTRTGDLAIVVHRDNVPDKKTGAPTRSQYLMTETWQLIEGRWMLHIVHIDAVHAAPPIIALTDAQLDHFAGTYRMDSQRLVIRRDGSHLVAQREGKTAFALQPETRDVFFEPNALRHRWIFQIDTKGRVVGLVSRDENRDSSIWERAKLS
jgi:hypothetical protein